MNRLILIGNGFDLAHGLKTSYKDFIFWYLDRCFDNAGIYANSEPHEDKFLRITVMEYYAVMDLYRVSGEKGLSRYLYDNGVLGQYLNFFEEGALNGEESGDLNTELSIPLAHTIKFKSGFFKRLIDSCLECGWVDIENEFYEALKIILNHSVNGSKVTNILKEEIESELRELNSIFSHIISLLQEYLSTISPVNLHTQYSEILESPIYKDDIVIPFEHLENDGQSFNHFSPKDTLIVNFNYTDTVEKYFIHNGFSPPSRQFKVNYIHGKLNDPKNPIIFGFGDELDADYQTMELEKAKGFFEYIKSFRYFKTSNYHNLVRFIDADDFQVYILGHSCGISDRTMLNMIFEHPQCKSIKIFYHGTEEKNNYTALTHEISRHFRNKSDMRKKIVPFARSMAMPQVE